MNASAIDDETLGLLNASIERYGEEKYGFAARRAHLQAAPWFSRKAWQDYAALGWLALPRPHQQGGFANHPAALGALMRYAGETLALEPLFAGVVLCGPLLAACGDAAEEHLSAFCAGHRHFALAHAEELSDGLDGVVGAQVRAGKLNGRKTMVLHGDAADQLIVSARNEDGALGLFLVAAAEAGVRKTICRLVDGRGAAGFEFVDATTLPLCAPGAGLPLLRETFDHARLAMCSEALGAIHVLNRDTLAYLKTRKQFGRPIGTNQVLQHRMVEMVMQEQECAAVIEAAQRAVHLPGNLWRRAVAGAAAHVMQVGRHVSHEAVQMHGGIGMTDELAIGHYFKRIMVINRLLGDRDAHLAAFAQADAACAAATGGTT